MKNILHISDLHASNKVLKMDQYKIKNTIDCLIADVKKISDIDTVFITGDLAFSGNENEYDMIKNHVIDELIKQLQIDISNIYIVPGNHDIQREKWVKSDNTSKKGLFLLYDTNEIDDIFNEKNEEKNCNWFENYNSFKKSINESKSPIISTNLFDIFNHNNIGIACLNSSWLANGDDKNKLAVTNAQMQSALLHMKKFKQKILLMHHPLDWLYEQDRSRISEYIHTAGFNMFLYGHMHEHHVIQESHFNNNSVIKVQAGKFDISDNDEYAGYSVISLHQTNNLQSGKIIFRKYNNNKIEFSEWNQRVPNGIMSFSLTDKCIFNIDTFSEISGNLIEQIEYDLLCNTGLEQEKKKRLSEIFIEPKLKENSRLNIDMSTDKETPISVSDLINSGKSYCIFGNENTGKTTLAKKIAIELLTRQKFKNIDNIVYYFDCETLSGEKVNEFKIRQKIPLFYESTSKSYNQLKEFIKKIQDDIFSNQSIIIFDSLDKCDNNINKIFNIIRENPNARFILLAKNNIKKIIDGLIDEHGLIDKFSSVSFAGIGRSDIRHLIEKWLPQNLIDNKATITKQAFNSVNKAGMPNNHFIYSMIMSIYERKSHNMKTYLHEADLLENFIEILLHKHCLTDGNKPQYKDLILFLGYIANNLAAKKTACLSRNQIIMDIIDFNKQIGQDFDYEGYIQPIKMSGILIQVDNGFCFSQSCFFNYCLAHYLSKTAEKIYEQESPIDYIYFDKALEYLSAIKKNDVDLINFIGNKTHKYLEQTANAAQIDFNEHNPLNLLRSLIDKNIIENITDESIQDGYSQRNKSEDERDQILDEVAPINEEGRNLKVVDDDNVTPNILLQRSLSLYARTYRAAEHIMSEDENDRLLKDIYVCYMKNLSLGLFLYKTKFKELLLTKIKQRLKDSSEKLDQERIDTFIRFTASFFPMWIIELMSTDLFNQRQLVKMKKLRTSLNENIDKIILTFALCELDDIDIISEIKSLEYKENHEVALLLFKFVQLSNFNFSIKDKEKDTLLEYVRKTIGKRKSLVNDYTSISTISSDILSSEDA